MPTPPTPEPPKPLRGATSLWRAGRSVWLLGLVAVLALALGFGLGALVRSPAQVAADAAPPPEGLLTAPVEQRQITSAVVGRADVTFDGQVGITPSIPDGVNSAVVTGRVPTVGEEVIAGQVILEVSGRPVFVLPGQFKAYRSMGPGSTGPDVAQLREALAALGLDSGAQGEQSYDWALAQAVALLYSQAGYPAPGSQDQGLAQAVRDATDSVTDAKNS